MTTTGPRALVRRSGALLVMLFALGPAVIGTAPAQAASAPSAKTVAAYEARVYWKINQVRVHYHRGRVKPAACPDRYAESWAAYLARTGRFYHREMMPFLRGCKVQRVAENLARGNSSADNMVVAWMKSPGHRANILDGRLTKIGVAAVYSHGQWTVATNFTRP